MKHCSKCQQEKNLSEYGKNASRYDGLQEYCRPCKRKIDRDYYQNNLSRKAAVDGRRDLQAKYARKFVMRYKRFSGCKVCNEKEPVCLDFHHLDPTQKDLEVTRLTAYSFKRLKEEIRKCVVVCSNCHRKIHAGIVQL